MTEIIPAILAKNFEEIELEPVEKDKQYFRPKRELYFVPLAIAMLLAGLLNWKRKLS